MGKATHDTCAAIRAADQVIWRLEPQLCAKCEDVCYSLEGRAQGFLGGANWETPVAWVTHQPLTVALRVLLSTTGSQLARLEAEQAAIDSRELQASLFDTI